MLGQRSDHDGGAVSTRRPGAAGERLGSDNDALIRQRDITKDAQPRKARLPIAVRAGGSVISAKDVEPAVRSQ